MDKRYAVGIDLGTSNSALAFCRSGEDERVEVLPVTQLLSFHSVGELPILPSVLYLPLEKEAEGAGAALPWGGDLRPGIAGQFAREHGALVPNRLVSSAKSWLCNLHVGPEEPVLPWGSDLGERKLSAFEASRRYLSHLREAFLWALRERGEAAGVEDCEVVVGVPASFDEVSRLQTHRAAQAAGWGEVTLLEEQQAAFYHWIAESGAGWRERVSPGEVVLVCDVGGGTADFSLVAVSERQGALELERVSVGDHILLGGDNMDLALAYTVRAELEARGQKIDSVQFLSLTHSCRVAKEALFADPALSAYPISIPGRGSSLLAGTVGAALTRATFERVVLDGFLPRTGAHEHPVRRRGVGLHELGLDYAADPVLSKHLASFLARSRQNTRSSESLLPLVEGRVRKAEGVEYLCPTAVLFNGGVFKAEPLRGRILELLREWNGGSTMLGAAA
jgi:molecular chaperone DnaK (HSP70)